MARVHFGSEARGLTASRYSNKSAASCAVNGGEQALGIAESADSRVSFTFGQVDVALGECFVAHDEFSSWCVSRRKPLTSVPSRRMAVRVLNSGRNDSRRVEDLFEHLGPGCICPRPLRGPDRIRGPDLQAMAPGTLCSGFLLENDFAARRVAFERKNRLRVEVAAKGVPAVVPGGNRR